MICQRCKVEMRKGIAIHSNWDDRALYVTGSGPTVTARNLMLVDCWKCPKCGDSRDIEPACF
jgi:hypothetical protein